ncbi:ATP-binding protein, partial [Actinocorallia lasiicapitis]
AALVAPGRVPDGDAVRELCAALEGIPLAIELAAAMTRVLSVEQVRERLTDRFQVLRGGSRNGPGRQRTLWETVDWSYQTLGAGARALLSRLTVFSGGWTLEMAEAVCTDVPDVLGATTELADKSLIALDGRVGGLVRFRMLDTVRDFAHAHLPEEAMEALRHRHLDHMVSLHATGGRMISLQDPDMRRHYHLIEGTLPNLFAALSFAAEHGRADAGLRILTDMRFAIVAHGLFEPYRSALDRLLAAGDVPGWLRGRALALRGLMCLYCGDVEDAKADCATAIELSQGPEGYVGQTVAASLAGLLHVPGALAPEEAKVLADAHGDVALRLWTTLAQAQAAQLTGRGREAHDRYREALARVAPENHWPIGLALIGLAELAEARGDLPGALEHYEDARRHLFDIDYVTETRGEMVRCLLGLGRVSLRIGDTASAGPLLRDSLERCRGLGMRSYAGELVATLARFAALAG